MGWNDRRASLRLNCAIAAQGIKEHRSIHVYNAKHALCVQFCIYMIVCFVIYMMILIALRHGGIPILAHVGIALSGLGAMLRCEVVLGCTELNHWNTRSPIASLLLRP